MLKFGYTAADNHHLLFLLSPTDKLVEIATGTQAIYTAESGFYHPALQVSIDKSCAGFNFFLLCFVLFVFLGLRHTGEHLKRFAVLPLALVVAYGVTIVVNTSRILASLVVQQQIADFVLIEQHVLHEAIGIATNLTFLIVVYSLTEKFLTNLNQHAKTA